LFWVTIYLYFFGKYFELTDKLDTKPHTSVLASFLRAVGAMFHSLGLSFCHIIYHKLNYVMN